MHKATRLPIPQIDGATNAGARGKHNDDYADQFRIKASQNNRDIYVLALADGVTSTGSGDQASRLAVEETKKALRQDNNKQPLRQRLEQAVRQANQAIWQQAQANPGQRNMSTTFVLAAIDGNHVRVIHVGDSRAYLVRDNAIHCLTLDHTWVQEALDVGRLDEQSARHHPNRHVIQRYLGISPQVEIDHEMILPGTYHLPPAERKRVETVAMQAGDVLLLCSDGLTESVSDEEIKAEVLRNRNQPKQVADALIELALERNERDNITVLLLAFPFPEAAPLALPPQTVQAQVSERPTQTGSNRWLSRTVTALAILLLACLTVIGLGNLGGKSGMQISSAATIHTPSGQTEVIVAAPPLPSATTLATSQPVAVAVNIPATAPAVQQFAAAQPLVAKEPKTLRLPTDELPTPTATAPRPTLTPTPLLTRAPTAIVAVAATTVTIVAPAQFQALNLQPQEDLVVNNRREFSFRVAPPPLNGEKFLIVGWEAQRESNNQFTCLPPAPARLQVLSNAAGVVASSPVLAIPVSEQELRARGIQEKLRYCWGVALDTSPLGLISPANQQFTLRIEPQEPQTSNEPTATPEPPTPIPPEPPTATPAPPDPPTPAPPDPPTPAPVETLPPRNDQTPQTP